MSKQSKGWTFSFLLLFIVLNLIIGAVEAVLLNVKYDYFRGGFLATNVLNTSALKLLFAFSSITLDAALILFLWLILIPLFSGVLRLSNSRLMAALALFTLVVPFTWDYIHYELQSYLSDIIDLKLIWELAGRNPQELLSQWGGHLTYLSAGIVLGLLVLALLIIAWRHQELPGMARFSRSRPPSVPNLARWTVLGTAVAAIILAVVTFRDSPVLFGLLKKPSGMVLRQIIQWTTDIDRDGYGFMSKPRDPAPLNSKIHPYAIDIPGNGIDENGVAGDHPADRSSTPESIDEATPWSRTPNVLLILLESVRGDILEKEVNGREVVPFMRKLAAEGAQSKRAYSHCGYTVPSRAQLFGGRIQPYPGQTTLIDDFKRNGYYVVYFSGQDDSFGDSGPLVGYDRADIFYDARSDKDKRYTQFSNSASLAVSCKLVNRRVLSFLDKYDPTRPLFLYVNYHDTHFPYHHRDLDNILGIKPIERGQIRPGASEAIWKTYANAASNVDRAIGELFNAWSSKLQGRPLLLLIVSDHAESLFEDGFLGHGYSAEDPQTRIPFIVWGAAGRWYEPLGLADIRGQLLRNMTTGGFSGSDRPEIAPDPSRRVVQHIGAFTSPRFLAWRSLEGMDIYDFWNDVTITKEERDPGFSKQFGLAERLLPLIWDWESLVFAEHQAYSERRKTPSRWHRPE